jgi:hypothetical protein
MGLDMYLNAKRFMSKNFNRGDDILQERVSDCFPELAHIKSHFGDSSPVREVKADVGYWRKANAVHDWFVNNVQDGEDDCGYYAVSRTQLADLKTICETVLANRERAGELLPTAPGFFFGDTNYGDFYFEDVQHTIKVINDALSLPHAWDFEYHSSW